MFLSTTPAIKQWKSVREVYHTSITFQHYFTLQIYIISTANVINIPLKSKEKYLDNIQVWSNAYFPLWIVITIELLF